ncbi:LacI family DNA-binding transcriptional regulator [Bifidobacterium pseudocatenulatum]|uniref:LacI family DNA-binding transcriptional regulator n=1 Tax=Bifidobacterium pseudocatenulatum TaxID=28026 RepID=UPI0030EEC8B2
MARVTVYDIAEKAGVSTATVSFAFRHPDKVKDDTKARILRISEELGYVPSGNARGLARGRTGTLGMYAFDMLLERPQGSDLEEDRPDASSATVNASVDGDEPDVLAYPLYVDEVLRGFELECWKSGKGMLMGAASKKDDHRSVTDIAGCVDGLALMPSGYNDTLPLSMLAKTIPLVMVGVGDEKLPAAYLQCDNASGIRQIVDHLVEVHHINDMAFVGGVNGGACASGTVADDVVSRYDAFKKYLEERGLDSRGALLDDSFATSDEYLVSLCEAIESNRLPQALVCGTDQTAFGVIRLLVDSGIRVPEDVIVTGFDGILAGRLMTPRLTTIRQPMEELGRRAVRMLLSRNGKPWEKPEKLILPVRLVVRGSCGCG